VIELGAGRILELEVPDGYPSRQLRELAAPLNGPGFETVGPMASFAHLHPISRIVLTLEMWIGRLEVLTVLVLFRLEARRAARWDPA
jgi:hypothetical protein